MANPAAALHFGSQACCLGRRRRLLPAVALATALLPFAGPAASAGAAPAQELPSVAERVNVREVELVLEPPPVGKGLLDLRAADLHPFQNRIGPGVKVAAPALRGLADLEPADLLVFEDGQSRPVRRLEPLARAGATPWTLRIFFDLVLSRPDTVFDAALALASQAEALIRLGSVEIVAADPVPHTVLAPSREVFAIKEALARLAWQARSDPAARPFTPHPPPSPATLRRQCDRLVTSLTLAPPAGPHALLLVADTPHLSAAELHQLSVVSNHHGASPPANHGASPPASETVVAARVADLVPVPDPKPDPRPEDGPGTTLGETARLLAAYGWVTLALPIRRATGSREQQPEDDYARFRRQFWDDPKTPGGIPFLPLIVMLVQWLRGTRPAPAPDLRQVAPQLDPQHFPLVALVRPTAGMVVTRREALAPALDTLAARWHLWYEADASPAGRERPITVELAANSHEVRAPRWIRSSIPEDLSAARLRRLLDGDRLAAPLAVTVALVPPASTAAASAMTSTPLLQLDRRQPAGASLDATSGPLRVSFAWIDGARRIRISHQLLDPPAAARWSRDQTLRIAAPPPPPGNAALAVLIEDLATETWGGAVVDLHSL